MLITLPSAEFAERLSLERLNPGFEDAGEIQGGVLAYAGLALAGYLENVTPGRCVLFGSSELGYLDSLAQDDATARLGDFFAMQVACVLVASSKVVEPWILDVATEKGVAVYRSGLSPQSIQAAVSKRLRDWLAPVETIHGVMMDVSGMGVLLLGESGVGKSECALELIERGHRLVADDAVVVKRISDEVAIAEPREALRHAMELRGIGLIDVRALFGMGSITERKQIELVIRLEMSHPDTPYERLGVDQATTEVCGVDLPYLVIPVLEGKNLSILVEVAAMNQHLRNLGINTARDLTDDLDRRLAAKIAARRVDLDPPSFD